MHFFVADSMAECIIVSKKNQIMEQDYREKLTSVEQLALFVEQKCNMGHAAWAVVYFLAALVLLPAVYGLHYVLPVKPGCWTMPRNV